jgi:GNAT superfamily N-acetyltransferase
MFAGADLAHRIDSTEARLVAAIVERVRARRPGARAFVRLVAGGHALFAGVGSPVNKVIGIGFDGPPDEAEVAAVERAYFERGSEVRAEVATLARAETHAWLARRGYVLSGFENVLGRDLAGGASGARHAVDPAIAVEQVRAADEDTWVATLTAGFAAPDLSGAGGDQPSLPDEEMAALFDDFYKAEGVRRYLARRGGDVAGAASMRVDGEVALLTGAATLPAHRRRGVQRALLAARLADAVVAGCRIAVVVTQPGSISQANSQRQGFALLYSRAVLVKGA